MDKITNFNIGDYIGDSEDICFEVIDSDEKSYTIENKFNNLKRTILKEEKPNPWNNKKYAADYHILRTNEHPDVTNFPIGSVWKCTIESGLNDPDKNTVTIVDYAISEQTFWVCNNNMKSLSFIARDKDLEPIEN